MLQKNIGFILSCIKYNDKSNIVHIYTQQEGVMSFLVPATRSRKSLVNAVLFQPLSPVEFEADIRPRSGIHPIKEAHSYFPLQTIPYNPYKSGIAMFLAEFLDHILKEEKNNAPLFAYLHHSIQWLDTCESNFANFHLVFLIRLSRFLGFYPNLDNYTDQAYFDLLNACFVSAPPLHRMYLLPPEAAHIHTLTRINYKTMHLFTMNRKERNRCLDIINEYYRLHLPDFPELKSWSVLQEIFGTL